MATGNTSVSHALESGPLTSTQLQAVTGLSQPAVSRQIGLLGDSVVKLPNGRQPRYALTRNAFGAGDTLPLLTVDTHGNTRVAARIRPLLGGGFFVDLHPDGSPLLLGADGTGVFSDLPYYLHDLRPQGFVGRQIARELAERSGKFPTDPNRWNANQVGTYLLSNAEDLPGNLQFGDSALLRSRRAPMTYLRDEYPAIAEAVLAGELAGFSAGGEQPKFTVYSKERSAHVLVKFSPAGNGDVARRWRDILITEYHATQTLHAASIPAAKATLVERGDRLFLEAERFDRAGQHGRSSMISLQMVDAEFVGNGADWPIVMRKLAEQKLVSQEHHHNACLLWEFGFLINNTDMHLGNLSLAFAGDVFSILPIYDMCSMGFAPVRGEVKPFSFAPKSHSSKLNCFSENKSTQYEIRAMAMDFWERVANDARISDEFSEFLTLGDPLAQSSD